jgi:hypothetical protein
LAQPAGKQTNFPKFVAHLPWTQPHNLTTNLEEAIDFACDLLHKDLVLTLMRQRECGVGNERVDTIGAIGDLLLILRSEQRNEVRLKLRRIHYATPYGIRHRKSLGRQAVGIELQTAYPS